VNKRVNEPTNEDMCYMSRRSSVFTAFSLDV